MESSPSNLKETELIAKHKLSKKAKDAYGYIQQAQSIAIIAQSGEFCSNSWASHRPRWSTDLPAFISRSVVGVVLGDVGVYSIQC